MRGRPPARTSPCAAAAEEGRESFQKRIGRVWCCGDIFPERSKGHGRAGLVKIFIEKEWPVGKILNESREDFSVKMAELGVTSPGVVGAKRGGGIASQWAVRRARQNGIGAKWDRGVLGGAVFLVEGQTFRRCVE